MTWAPKPATVEAFTEGDCWALALEIRRLTGYPLLFSTMFPGRAADYEMYPEDFPWDHVAVMLPDGNVLDVFGIASREAFSVRWGTKDSLTVSDSALVEKLTNDQVPRYFKPNPRATARRLLNHFNIPTTGRRHRDALPI